MTNRVSNEFRQVIPLQHVSARSRLEAAANQIFQETRHTTAHINHVIPSWDQQLATRFPHQLEKLLDQAFPELGGKEILKALFGEMSFTLEEKNQMLGRNLLTYVEGAIPKGYKSAIVHQDKSVFKTTILTQAPPPNQKKEAVAAPYPSLEALLKDKLGPEASFSNMRKLAGCARNMDDMVYHVALESPPAGLAKPNIRIAFSHNSELNGESYYDEKGQLVQITHAVAASEHRKSPSVHLLRRFSNETTGETIAYSGRPETDAKVLEQAIFIFRSELQEQQKGRAGKLRFDAETNTYTLDYTVNSLIDTLYAMRFTWGQEEAVRLHVENEISALNALKKGPIIITGWDGKPYTVHLNPILLHTQWSFGRTMERTTPPSTSGKWFSDEITEQGIEELKPLVEAKRLELAGDSKLKHLNTAYAKLQNFDFLEPDERLFYIALLCEMLNIPLAIHCKSSKDRTGAIFAFACALHTWLKSEGLDPDFSKLFEKSKLDPALREIFDKLFTGHMMAAHQVSNYGLGANGVLAGAQLEAERDGLDLGEAPPTLAHLFGKDYTIKYPFWHLFKKNPIKFLFAIFCGVCSWVIASGVEITTLVLALSLIGDALTWIHCKLTGQNYIPFSFARRHLQISKFFTQENFIVSLVARPIMFGYEMAYLFTEKVDKKAPSIEGRHFAKEGNKLTISIEAAKLLEELAEIPEARLQGLKAGLAGLKYDLSNYPSLADQALMREVRTLAPTFKAILSRPKLVALALQGRSKEEKARLFKFVEDFVTALDQTPFQQLESLTHAEYFHLLNFITEGYKDTSRLTSKEKVVFDDLKELSKLPSTTKRQMDLVEAFKFYDPIFPEFLNNLPPERFNHILAYLGNASAVQLFGTEAKLVQVILNNLELLRAKKDRTAREEQLLQLCTSENVNAAILTQIDRLNVTPYSKLLDYLGREKPDPISLSPSERRLLLNIANHMSSLKSQNPEQAALLMACRSSHVAMFRFLKTLSKENLTYLNSKTIYETTADQVQRRRESGDQNPLIIQRQEVYTQFRQDYGRQGATSRYFIDDGKGCLIQPPHIHGFWDETFFASDLGKKVKGDLSHLLSENGLQQYYGPFIECCKLQSISSLRNTLIESLPMKKALQHLSPEQQTQTVTQIVSYIEKVQKKYEDEGILSLINTLRVLLPEGTEHVPFALQAMCVQTAQSVSVLNETFAFGTIHLDGLALGQGEDGWDIHFSREPSSATILIKFKHRYNLKKQRQIFGSIERAFTYHLTPTPDGWNEQLTFDEPTSLVFYDQELSFLSASPVTEQELQSRIKDRSSQEIRSQLRKLYPLSQYEESKQEKYRLKAEQLKSDLAQLVSRNQYLTVIGECEFNGAAKILEKVENLAEEKFENLIRYLRSETVDSKALVFPLSEIIGEISRGSDPCGFCIAYPEYPVTERQQQFLNALAEHRTWSHAGSHAGRLIRAQNLARAEKLV